MSPDDRDLLDAENQAKALMREAAGNAVLREAVEDWKREAARLKARVEELEAVVLCCLTTLQGVRAMAQEIRNDWSEFDGRSHRNEVMWMTDSAVDKSIAVLGKERP